MAKAHINIEHGSWSDLVVDLAVGDPEIPEWSINVWNKGGGASRLSLTIDVSQAVKFLPPSISNRWFLRVYDSESGNQGQVTKFSIVYDNQTYDSTCIPVAIRDTQTSYSYIPGGPLELAISRRISIRDFISTDDYTIPEISWELLSKVLWAGYGYSSWNRTTPSICSNYPLVIYVCNKSSAYTYDPSEQALKFWKYGDYRFSGGMYRAPIELFIALDTNKFTDVNLASMEAGGIIQNIYLEANSLGLGTVCVGTLNKTNVHDVLGLPVNEVVLYGMPLGYPASYAFYNFTCVIPSESMGLPEVKQSSVFLDDALTKTRKSHAWREVPLTAQETSQILWSAYGRSYLMDMRPSFWSFEYRHRTVASAGPTYPLTIWMVNSTGTYTYDPWNHRVLTQALGDRRTELSQSIGAPWMASAPAMLLIVLNSAQMIPGRLDWAYTEIGSVIQNVFLESVAWGLVADFSNIVDENGVKTVLGLTEQTDLRPIAAITVGHPLVRGDINSDGIVDIYDAILLSIAFDSTPISQNWNPDADINKDDVVDIYDAIILASNFGTTT